MEEIFLKRIYEPFDENDGERILIDRCGQEESVKKM